MVKLKTAKDIPYLVESGRRLGLLLKEIATQVKPGITTAELDDLAQERIKELGDKPAFLNFRPGGSRLAYPAALCVSINDEIVHGIPSKREILEGDVVTIDLGLNHQGYFSDHAVTLAVGEVSPEIKKLLAVTKESLDLGIKQAVVGNHTGDIGFAIESCIKQNGLKVVGGLAGHGLGFSPHEDPLVPNEGQKGQGYRLVPGLVLALEPMVALGTSKIDLLDDGFTFVTRDGSISAHFEHTVLITEEGPQVLTKI